MQDKELDVALADTAGRSRGRLKLNLVSCATIGNEFKTQMFILINFYKSSCCSINYIVYTP